MQHNRWSASLVSVLLLCVASIFVFGFTKSFNTVPQEVYTIYLDGEKIGVVKSEDEFLDYINTKEEAIKARYGVDTVYSPKGVDIRKTITYNNNIDSNMEIYNKIVASKKFTIKGVVITVTDEESDEEPVVINVLNKEIFDEALTTTIRAFVDEEQYDNYMNSTQEEIEETGSLIENIDLKEKVTYRNDLISVSEKIFTDVDELTKYLMYGTLEEQSTYIVKEGDTISSVANANKLNVEEFLIANPQFTSENNLLYESQEVVVGLIDPVISVIVEMHSVEDEVKAAETEIQYDDDLPMGTEYVSREGEDGLYRVTNKYQYINGQLADVAMVSSTEIKPSISKIVVRGDKYIPNVADLSYWAWPTETPYTITTYYEYRWGSFHDAIDIYVGYGSDVYAANNGTVYRIGTGCVAGYLGCNGRQGNYILINHNAGGYYTIYMHLKDVLVTEGQTVARGQKIGTMGNSGEVSPVPSASSPYAGTHLHFGVRMGSPYGSTINPFNLF